MQRVCVYNTIFIIRFVPFFALGNLCFRWIEIKCPTHECIRLLFGGETKIIQSDAEVFSIFILDRRHATSQISLIRGFSTVSVKDG